MTNICATSSAGPSGANNIDAPKPLPVRAESADSGVVRMKSDSVVASPGGPAQTAQEDAERILEPAGYEKFPANTALGADTIAGVLAVTKDLVGMTTVNGDHYWLSRFDNPVAFTQAQMSLDNLNTKHAGAASEPDKKFLVAGYERYTYEQTPGDPSRRSDPLPPNAIVGVYQDHDWAAFIYEFPEDGKQAMRYMHKDDEPAYWMQAMDAAELIRDGKDPRKEMIAP